MISILQGRQSQLFELPPLIMEKKKVNTTEPITDANNGTPAKSGPK